jgi:hypothetical protein
MRELDERLTIPQRQLLKRMLRARMLLVSEEQHPADTSLRTAS